jgi:transposase
MATKKSLPESERAWLKVLGTMNEAQARLCVAQKALELGRGGISQLSALTGMSRPTITKGIAELKGRQPAAVLGAGARVRRTGGGRNKVEQADAALLKQLQRIVEETTAGDPMSALKWTAKSTRAIAAELGRRGHPVSHMTVARCLHELDYSLQANRKAVEGEQHVDRDAQFRYLNRQVRAFAQAGDPVVSVDTKKKELVGAFRNPGRTWRAKGQPEAVQVHDFPHLGEGKAIPYGTYDVMRDRAVVNVGITHDTAEFAVESIRQWWRSMGSRLYPECRRLLICADAGGSNGYRLRAWKVHLQRLASGIGRAITVCHYPPGTSKWNKIEHRLFSHISIHWRGQPLKTYETVVNLIGTTSTRTGLKVKARLDRRNYEIGESINDEQMKALRLQVHKFHPDWNYTLLP